MLDLLIVPAAFVLPFALFYVLPPGGATSAESPSWSAVDVATRRHSGPRRARRGCQRGSVERHGVLGGRSVRCCLRPDPNSVLRRRLHVWGLMAEERHRKESARGAAVKLECDCGGYSVPGAMSDGSLNSSSSVDQLTDRPHTDRSGGAAVVIPRVDDLASVRSQSAIGSQTSSATSITRSELDCAGLFGVRTSPTQTQTTSFKRR